MSVGELRPGEVSMTLTGVGINLTLEGFMDGTFISAERNEEAFSYQGGASGGGTRILNSDKSGRITFSLLQTASDNATLSKRILGDEGAGQLQFSVMIRDPSGDDIVSALTAWIVSYPVTAWSKDGDEGREWTIETGNLQFSLGGNTLL